MATFELKIIGEIDELAGIANRIAGAQTVTGEVNMRGEPVTANELRQAAADNGYVAPVNPSAPAYEAPKRRTKAKEAAEAGNAQTADAAAQAATGASPTEASSSAGSAETASPSSTPAADERPAPENITHPDQLLGSDVTPDMLKDAMTDALSKRLIPAAKVQGALKEATGGVASLSALWALPDDADRAAKAQAAYAALTGLTA